MKLKVAECIARTLREYGTKYFFLVSGGDPDFYAAIHDAGIRMVLCRSEKAAVYMADGYARISYKPGFIRSRVYNPDFVMCARVRYVAHNV